MRCPECFHFSPERTTKLTVREHVPSGLEVESLNDDILICTLSAIGITGSFFKIVHEDVEEVFQLVRG